MEPIFISYVAEDAGIVKEIASRLKAAGYGTWYFEHNVVSGSSYVKQISQALDQCRAFVLLASPRSVGSDQVTKEVMGAFERGKPFFPILVELRPSKLKQLQPEWRHAIGVTSMIIMGPEGVPDSCARIIDGLKALGIQPEAKVIGLEPTGRAPPAPASYTPKYLADKILAARASLEGERKRVTVLFVNVAGFTKVSEKMDPEEVHDLVNECLVLLTEEIHRYEGTIAQFLGDGLLALFGAPIAHEDAPRRALYAALGIRDRLRDYAQELKQKGIEFNVHMGLNTGLVVVVKIGDDLTMQYTAMGDTVNLALRMESAAEPGTILVSDNTYRLTEGYFDFKPLGHTKVKGKKEPVKSYQLLGVGRVRTRLGVSEIRGLTPFVGRKKELNHLIDCFGQAKGGQGQVVGITGEPGVGKSRLLLQLRSVLPHDEYSYLEGECHHYGDMVAYLPMLHILRSYCGIEEGEHEALSRKKLEQRISELDERLMAMLPPLQELMSLKVEDEQFLKLEPQLKRARIFEAIWSLFMRESQNRLLVLAVEDLQWIDKTSEEFLGYVIAHLGGARVLLILLYRPEFTPIWVSKTYYSQLRVDELPLETSAEMVQAILEEGQAAQVLIRLILDRAAGNPLFMEEFIRNLLERGYIERKDGHYVLTVKPSDIEVPETVQGIISARMDRLDKALKETMQVASVIGREFAYRILQMLTGTQEELRTYIFNLQELEFIYEKSVFPEPEYVFKHDLTQEVAYNSLLLKRRREIHERTGKAIEELYKDRLEEFYEVLAHHYSRSDNLEKAYEYLVLSVTRALHNHSLWEAYRFGRDAIYVLRQMTQTEENKKRGIEVRLLTSGPMTGLGYPEDSLQIIQEGESLANELGDKRSVALFCKDIGNYHFIRGDITRSAEYMEEAFRAAEEMQDVELTASIGLSIVMTGVVAEYRRIVEIAPQVLTLLEKNHKESESFGAGFNVYSVLLAQYGEALATLGDFQQGEVLCEKALRFALDVNDLYATVLVEHFYCWLYLLKGDGRRGLEHTQNAMRYAEQGQFMLMLGLLEQRLGWAYFLLGEPKTAQEHLQKAINLISDTQFASISYAVYLFLTLVDLEFGDLSSAKTHAEQCQRSAQSYPNKSAEESAALALGIVLGKTEKSRLAEAVEYIVRPIKQADERGEKTWCAMWRFYLGEVYADNGIREKALETLKKAKSAFRNMGMDYWLRRTQKVLERLQD